MKSFDLLSFRNLFFLSPHTNQLQIRQPLFSICCVVERFERTEMDLDARHWCEPSSLFSDLKLQFCVQNGYVQGTGFISLLSFRWALHVSLMFVYDHTDQFMNPLMTSQRPFDQTEFSNRIFKQSLPFRFKICSEQSFKFNLELKAIRESI